MRVAFVVQRYGEEIVGGAEALTRQLAMKMSDLWQVDVLTTAAEDYRTWENVFPLGVSQDGAVTIRRFKVDRPRDFEVFSSTTCKLEYKSTSLSEAEEQHFFEEQGPYSPDLISYIKETAKFYDAFIFVTYLYYHSVMGVSLVADRAYLLAAAHDEGPFYFTRFIGKLFASVKGVIYQTPEEQALIRRVYKLRSDAREIFCHMGVEPEAKISFSQERHLRRKFRDAIDMPYFLYLGRINEVKGCLRLFEAYSAFRDEEGMTAKLVMAGHAEIGISGLVTYFGHVDEVEKSFLLRHSLAFINPSPFESLSLVVLESWAHGRPVIVNGESPVLRGQCLRAGGGVFYHSLPVLRAMMQWAVANPKMCTTLGKRGYRYVSELYTWERTKGVLYEAIR